MADRSRSSTGVCMAVFRPRANDIAIFVQDGEEGAAGVVITLSEARALHGALGQALRLADCRDDPVSAVPMTTQSSMPGTEQHAAPEEGGEEPTGKLSGNRGGGGVADAKAPPSLPQPGLGG